MPLPCRARAASAMSPPSAWQPRGSCLIALRKVDVAHVWNSWLCRVPRCDLGSYQWPSEARIPRLRFGWHCDRQRTEDRSSTLSRQAVGARESACRKVASRNSRYRTHPLGYARAPLGRKRPSAQIRSGLRRTQRHYREPCDSARPPQERGAHLLVADGYRSPRPPHR